MLEFWKLPKKSINLKKFPFYSDGKNSIDINEINPEYIPHFTLDLILLSKEAESLLLSSGINSIGDLLLTPKVKAIKFLKNSRHLYEEVGDKLKHLIIFHKVFIDYRFQKLKFHQDLIPLRKIISKQATESSIKSLPLFTDLPPGEVRLEQMHPSFKANDDIFKLLLNQRANNVLKLTNCKNIFQLLMTPLTNMAIIPNCGYKTVLYIQKNLMEYILRPKAENINEWKSIDDMLLDMLSDFKEIDYVTFTNRVGLKHERSLTLQECGNVYSMSREAARQKVDKVIEYLLHPVTKNKMNKFWSGLERIVTEARIIRTKDLAKKISVFMEWEEDPKVHSLEFMLAFHGKYLITPNHLITRLSNKEIHCDGLHRLFFGQIRYYGFPYDKAKKMFLEAYRKSFPQHIAQSEGMLIDILEYNVLYKSNRFYIRHDKIFDREKNRRRRGVK